MVQHTCLHLSLAQQWTSLKRKTQSRSNSNSFCPQHNTEQLAASYSSGKHWPLSSFSMRRIHFSHVLKDRASERACAYTHSHQHVVVIESGEKPGGEIHISYGCPRCCWSGWEISFSSVLRCEAAKEEAPLVRCQPRLISHSHFHPVA